MTEWRIPGMPRVPGLSELLGLMQAQAESLADLPPMLSELNRAVGGLGEVLTATKQAAASAERTTARLERILDEIEEPILALRPGLERVAQVLNDPAIERIPKTIEAIEAAVVPLSAGVLRAQRRYDTVKDSAKVRADIVKARARDLAERAQQAQQARRKRRTSSG